MGNQCRKSQDLINGFLEGTLTPDESDALQKHLAVCHDCRKDLEHETRIIALIHSLPLQALSPEIVCRIESKTVGKASYRIQAWLHEKLIVPRWPRFVFGLAAVIVVLVMLRPFQTSRNIPLSNNSMDAGTARSQAAWSMAYISEVLQQTEMRVVSDVLLKDVPGTVKKSLEKSLPFLKGD